MVSFRGPQPSNFVPFTPNKWENFERRKENQGFKNLYIKIVRQSQLLISIDHLPLSSVTNGSLIKLHLFPFLTTLLFALQITVRDSQFFSKVTHFDKDNVKVTELPNKEAPEVNKPEQQPPFIPETMAYMTEFENSNNKNYNNDAYNTRFSETSYNNKYYNKDSYEGNQYELSDTKYTEEGYNNKYHNSYQNNYNNDAANEKYSYNNNNNKNYNAHNNRYNTYNSNAVSRYNGERQGISDTRFLEGGKYFYDVGTEMYNPTNYGDSSREVNTNNWYNNRGVNYNGYQNQEEFEDEHENFEP
ncbi:hypothetical protein D0Y65_041175 [Glycine soja]|uniref:Protein E6 n=1 Tax=Glycine soja TaxID=3848 RepID=A0A445GUS6_GLYSO|nr:hypothetical protein D0Y65_041175 [Glycine soja]